MIAPRGNHSVHGHFWIPIDDENCWAWSFDYHPTRALTAAEVEAMRDGKGIHTRTIPGTFIPVANRDNDYLMDRAGQRAGKTFSGVSGIAMQDASLQESMGPIDRPVQGASDDDRQRHHHGTATSDAGGAALAQQGVAPPGTDPASASRALGGGGVAGGSGVRMSPRARH